VKRNAASKHGELIRQLNPVLRGWANYHRHVVAKETFSYIDYRVWKSLWRWSCRRHDNRNKHWVKQKYFHSVGGDNWVFQSIDADNGLQRLLSCKDIPIKRHIKIRSEANPYDPINELYLEQRQIKRWKEGKMQRGKLRMIWERQGYRCPICHQLFRDNDDWDIHHVVRRVDGGGDEIDNLMMLHPNCHRVIHHGVKGELGGLSPSSDLPH
jgi:RNA-directed DNA polymerase